MIVNKSHGFVFIHIPKTGGTSVRSALLTLPDSAKNPVNPKTKHTTAPDLMDFAATNDPELRGLRLFAFVRNPWDRFASLHRYLLKLRKFPAPERFADFASLLETREPWFEQLHSVRPQCDFLTDGFFRIGRYETLEEDFAAICDALGLELHLKRLNATQTRPSDYRDLYTEEAAALVAHRYAADITRFGYSF